MRSRKRIRRKPVGLLRKVRKPIAPPTRIEEDPTKYRRSRERERLRREQEEEDDGQ
jgi:hypothetical protein